jgi:hypothetical protein
VRESGPGLERIVAGPLERPVKLVAAAVQVLAEPLVLIYVLLESGTLRPEGRWHAGQPLSRDDVGRLLDGFARFLEEDGRHALWILSAAEPAAVALDRRGLVTLYGPYERLAPVLAAAGLVEAPLEASAPHVRRPELDQEEARLLASLDWTWYPLEPGDDELG